MDDITCRKVVAHVYDKDTFSADDPLGNNMTYMTFFLNKDFSGQCQISLFGANSEPMNFSAPIIKKGKASGRIFGRVYITES